jgi:hypothetical protein
LNDEDEEYSDKKEVKGSEEDDSNEKYTITEVFIQKELDKQLQEYQKQFKNENWKQKEMINYLQNESQNDETMFIKRLEGKLRKSS